jgi:hypothetical protein
MRPCLKCGRPTTGTRCPEHAIRYGYATSHWQTVRKQRLASDGWLCRLRHDGCTVRATTVHLDPHCNGNHLLATLDNTVSACLHCHGVEDGSRASGNRMVEPNTGGTPPNLSENPTRFYPAISAPQEAEIFVRHE